MREYVPAYNSDDGILLANPALNLGRRGRSRPDKLSASDRTANIRPMSQEQLGAFLAASAWSGRAPSA